MRPIQPTLRGCRQPSSLPLAQSRRLDDNSPHHFATTPVRQPSRPSIEEYGIPLQPSDDNLLYGKVLFGDDSHHLVDLFRCHRPGPPKTARCRSSIHRSRAENNTHSLSRVTVKTHRRTIPCPQLLTTALSPPSHIHPRSIPHPRLRLTLESLYGLSQRAPTTFRRSLVSIFGAIPIAAGHRPIPGSIIDVFYENRSYRLIPIGSPSLVRRVALPIYRMLLSVRECILHLLRFSMDRVPQPT